MLALVMSTIAANFVVRALPQWYLLTTLFLLHRLRIACQAVSVVTLTPPPTCNVHFHAVLPAWRHHIDPSAATEDPAAPQQAGAQQVSSPHPAPSLRSPASSPSTAATQTTSTTSSPSPASLAPTTPAAHRARASASLPPKAVPRVLVPATG